MMKVYSWNVCYFVREVGKIAATIESFDFDVLCLQEVSPALLELLKALPFHLAYAVEAVRLERGGPAPVYVAVLSKLPMLGHAAITFSEPKTRLRTKLFIMGTALGWTHIRDRGAVYADIEHEGGLVRIASVHLSTMGGAANRRKEFEETVAQLGTGVPRIIAGDFNIIEFGPIKLLNWLLGGPVHEAAPWYPERAHIETHFKTLQFAHRHHGMITHPFSRSQLDHIVVSDDLTAGHACVHEEVDLSDHYPISAIVTPVR